MDGEVPEFRAAGMGRDVVGQDTLSIDDYYFTHELLEVLRHDDDEKPAASSSRPATDSNMAGESEMASWLCEIFQQQHDYHQPAADTTTTATTKSGGAARTGSGSGGRRRRSSSGKAAEQRRRDKINGKMRTLRQLMPTCTKTDKASTLEEVIQYIKSLQHQMQVLSNGYGMRTAIWPPSCMRPVGDVFGGQAEPMLLPPYPFFPTVFASCPQQVTGMPLNPIVHGSAAQQQQQQADRSSSSGARSRMASIRPLPLDHSGLN